MKANTLLGLFALSTNLYALSKDKELMDKLTAMAENGKHKWDEIAEEWNEQDVSSLIGSLSKKAEEAKVEFEQRTEQLADQLYKKLKIAHASELHEVKEQVEILNRAVYAAQQKIQLLEDQLKKLQ